MNPFTLFLLTACAFAFLDFWQSFRIELVVPQKIRDRYYPCKGIGE